MVSYVPKADSCQQAVNSLLLTTFKQKPKYKSLDNDKHYPALTWLFCDFTAAIHTYRPT